MSYLSIKSKSYSFFNKIGHKCKIIRKNYTNFAGTTVPPLTKQQYERAMTKYKKRGSRFY